MMYPDSEVLRRVKQVQSGGQYHREGEEIRKGWRRGNMEDILHTHV
jgi:hypothetical protein